GMVRGPGTRRAGRSRPSLLGGLGFLAELRAPLGGLGLVAGGLVELHQTPQGFLQADTWNLRRGLRAALLQAVIALEEQRLGLGVLLLPQQRLAEHGLRVERRPVVRKFLFAEGEALAEQRLGLGVLPVLQQVPADAGQEDAKAGIARAQAFSL